MMKTRLISKKSCKLVDGMVPVGVVCMKPNLGGWS